jgi:hypothetical protein
MYDAGNDVVNIAIRQGVSMPHRSKPTIRQLIEDAHKLPNGTHTEHMSNEAFDRLANSIIPPGSIADHEIPNSHYGWNVLQKEDGSLYICKGDHPEEEPCAFVRYVPEIT